MRLPIAPFVVAGVLLSVAGCASNARRPATATTREAPTPQARFELFPVEFGRLTRATYLGSHLAALRDDARVRPLRELLEPLTQDCDSFAVLVHAVIGGTPADDPYLPTDEADQPRRLDTTSIYAMAIVERAGRLEVVHNFALVPGYPTTEDRMNMSPPWQQFVRLAWPHITTGKNGPIGTVDFSVVRPWLYPRGEDVVFESYPSYDSYDVTVIHRQSRGVKQTLAGVNCLGTGGDSTRAAFNSALNAMVSCLPEPEPEKQE